MHVAPEFHDTATRIRASYHLVPALLAVHGRAVLPWPGGCRIGERGMEQHFKVYEAFGDRTIVNDHGYAVEAGETGTGSVSVMLPFRSRGATIAATRGNGLIEGVRSKDVAPMVAALRWLGVPVDAQQNALNVRAEGTRHSHQPLRAIASLSPRARCRLRTRLDGTGAGASCVPITLYRNRTVRSGSVLRSP